MIIFNYYHNMLMLLYIIYLLNSKYWYIGNSYYTGPTSFINQAVAFLLWNLSDTDCLKSFHLFVKLVQLFWANFLVFSTYPYPLFWAPLLLLSNKPLAVPTTVSWALPPHWKIGVNILCWWIDVFSTSLQWY